MKRISQMVLALIVALNVGLAAAQPAERGDVGIYFDPSGTLTGAFIAAFVPFNYYVVATDPPGGMEGYEFGVSHDPRVTVLSSVTNPATAFNFGPAPTNFIVGTGGICLDPASQGSTQIVLVEFQGLTFAPDADLAFCLLPATPSGFVPPTPGYLVCSSPGDIRPFGYAYDGCAVGNPTAIEPPIAVRQQHWGAVKSLYSP